MGCGLSPFTHHCAHDQTARARASLVLPVCEKWTFATAQLAAMYGLTSHSPYTERAFVEWAVTNTVSVPAV